MDVEILDNRRVHMTKWFFSAAFAMSMAFAGAADAKTYSCTITPDGSRHWIAKTLLVNIDDRSGAIEVFDDIIQKYHGKPLTGKLSVETDKRITIKWTVRRVRDNYANNTARFFFRASFFKATGKAMVSSIPGGWDNIFGGRGRCTVLDDKSWPKVLASTPVPKFSARGKARFFMAGEHIVILP